MKDLKTPTRHPIEFEGENFWDEEKLEQETRRVFDICHGCRRCFNLCDSFPKLFDLIDESANGELDTVKSEDFSKVVEQCTLCDMCFTAKCPYVPPHAFDVDFPHLMLRHKAVKHKKGETSWVGQQLSQVDRNNKLLSNVAPIANWMIDCKNHSSRLLLEKTLKIDKDAYLPKIARQTFLKRSKDIKIEINRKAPAFGQKAIIYANCYINYHNLDLGEIVLKLLAYNGIEAEIVYPECCGMPVLEQGNLKNVALKANKISKFFDPYIRDGLPIITLVPSCAFMLKSEWPLLCPGNEYVQNLKNSTYDLSEYFITLSKKYGLVSPIQSLAEGVTVHMSCHSRAQNIGNKAVELLKLIPDLKVEVIERCSGHGGTWGMMKDNFIIAKKVGKPVADQAIDKGNHYLVSECPLASEHIKQMVGDYNFIHTHPIVILAHAYGICNACDIFTMT